MQFHVPERPGLVLDGNFPALVGVLAYALARYGPLLREAVPGAFTWRDGWTGGQQLLLLAGVSVGASVALTFAVDPPIRDQLTVIIGALLGYVLLVPPAQGATQAGAQR